MADFFYLFDLKTFARRKQKQFTGFCVSTADLFIQQRK